MVPWLAVLTLPLDAGLIGAFAIDYRRARRTRLSAVRRLPPLLVQGQPAQVLVEVSSGQRRSVSAVLREGLHPALASGPERQRLEISFGGRLLWRYALTPKQRGAVRFGALTARVLGPWRLAWADTELVAPQTVRVYPQIRWGGSVGKLLELAQRRQLGLTPMRLRGQGSEPYALRPYLPGDPASRVHWKATARHGRLIVREETWERGTRLVLLLDAGRSMAGIEGQRSKLDAALAAALVLTRVAQSRGDRVTLIAFSDRVERVAKLPSGARGAGVAYRLFYDLEARLAEPAFELAFEQAARLESRRATVILFTCVLDLGSAELLRRSLQALVRRHRVLLVNLEDADLSRLAWAPPSSVLEAFAKVSALEILEANRELAVRLRRLGITVASAPSDRLALETLDAYLGRARGRTATRAGFIA